MEGRRNPLEGKGPRVLEVHRIRLNDQVLVTVPTLIISCKPSTLRFTRRPERPERHGVDRPRLDPSPPFLYSFSVRVISITLSEGRYRVFEVFVTKVGSDRVLPG